MRSSRRVVVVGIRFLVAAAVVHLGLAQETGILPTGRPIARVECRATSGQNYALYLPSRYGADRKWPVLFVFDPAARGRLAVDVFRAAAEKYGYVVAGSNNSRNGPWSESLKAADAMWQDAHERLSLDPKQVYAAGFSGGARVAGAIARRRAGEVAGVIGCGADFNVEPDQGVGKDLPFVFFGAVGLGDFNFSELMKTDEKLGAVGVPHRVAVFRGEHDWPPVEIIAAAIEWLELQAMKTGRRERDPALIERLFRQRLQEADAAEAGGDLARAFQRRQEMSADFDGLRDVAEVRAAVDRMKQSKAVGKALERKAKSEAHIAALEVQYWASFNKVMASVENGTAGPGRARQAIADIRLPERLKQAWKNSQADEDIAATRFVGGVLTGSFSRAQEAIEKKDYPRAVFNYEIAVGCLPNDPYLLFALARAHALNQDGKSALEALQKSIEKGFSAIAQIESSPEFDPLRNSPEYVRVLGLLKQKLAAPARP